MTYWWFWTIPAANIVIFVGLAVLIQWDKHRSTKKSDSDE